MSLDSGSLWVETEYELTSEDFASVTVPGLLPESIESMRRTLSGSNLLTLAVNFSGALWQLISDRFSPSTFLFSFWIAFIPAASSPLVLFPIPRITTLSFSFSSKFSKSIFSLRVWLFYRS